MDNITDLNGRISGVSSTVSALQVSAGNLWTANGGNISYTGGNVGIGTATPGALVHVYKDSGNNAEIDIQSTAGANKHWAVYNDRTNNSLKFWNNDAAVEKNILTLGNTGNVGIGTVSPNAKLHVVGNTIVEGTISTLRSATDYNAISLTNSGGVQVHLNANGNAE